MEIDFSKIKLKFKILNQCFQIINLVLIPSTYILIFFNIYIWRPPSLSELTPMIFNTGLTHLGSEASNYVCIFMYLFKFI